MRYQDEGGIRPRPGRPIGDEGPELTYDPGWAYCPRCNSSADDYNLPNCAYCGHRSILPIPTTRARPNSK